MKERIGRLEKLTEIDRSR